MVGWFMLVNVGYCWLLLSIVLLVVPIDVVFLLGLVVVINLYVSSLKKARPSPVRNKQGFGCRECPSLWAGATSSTFPCSPYPPKKNNSPHQGIRTLSMQVPAGNIGPVIWSWALIDMETTDLLTYWWS